MQNIIRKFIHTFFRKDLELRIKIFNLLAITGFLISVAMGIAAISTGLVSATFINFSAAILSIVLMIYSSKTGKYQLCYAITIFIVFYLMFPMIFFTGGGYKGGMPFFFIFAVVFTIYMLDGWKMLIITIGELILYITLCFFAYYYPEKIVAFDTELLLVVDVIIGFTAVSITLGITMFAQIRLYKTQQSELEKAKTSAESANKAKSAFLANISHEIRTPIHIILSMNEIIRRENHVPQVCQCSSKIDEASKMLLSLIDNVLDVSKIESGKIEIIPETYHTKELIQTLNLIGSTRCEKKNLIFEMDIDNDLPDTLFGDDNRLKQIVSNLISNATKYTEKGTVFVTVTKKDGQAPDEILLCFSVKDTGIGIKQHELDTLFEAFTRADLASHRAIEGTGLGLAIVKSLTTLMGGKIDVISSYGQGSTFSVEIPQKIVSEQETKTKDIVQNFIAPDCKVLVVDDNHSNLSAMQMLLADSKIQVDLADSGFRCIEMVKDNNYHLILMDYMMPEMSGVDTLRELKKNPGFSTPVIALTANVISETKTLLLNEGFAEFISKPVPWETLKKTLLEFLPQELITKVTVSNNDNIHHLYEQLKAELQPYGISVDNALHYFDQNLFNYSKTASIFLKYNDSEYSKAIKAIENHDFESLHYIAHTVKGKAKNMGIDLLYKVSEKLEILCKDNNSEEAISLAPYFMYLWKQSVKGIQILSEKCDAEISVPDEYTDNNINIKECETKLSEYIRYLRRKPAIKTVDLLLRKNLSSNKSDILKEIKKSLEIIDFDQAEFLLNKYLSNQEDK